MYSIHQEVDISEKEIRVTSEEIEEAYNQVSSDVLEAIQQIIKNITIFHEAQKRDLWFGDRSIHIHVTERGNIIGYC
jgi:histidinol dehydrogenase